jgi:hypothetical protein
MAELIPMLAIMSTFGAGIIIVAIVMYFNHRKEVMRNQERLAAIEKGIPLPDLAKEQTRSAYSGHCYSPLYRGIRLLFIGAGLAFALYVSVGEQAAVWGAFVAFIGLGHLAYWLLVERRSESGSV